MSGRVPNEGVAGEPRNRSAGFRGMFFSLNPDSKDSCMHTLLKLFFFDTSDLSGRERIPSFRVSGFYFLPVSD